MVEVPPDLSTRIMKESIGASPVISVIEIGSWSLAVTDASLVLLAWRLS